MQTLKDDLRILIVDSGPHDRALAAAMLSRAFTLATVVEVGTPSDFALALTGGPFDVIVSERRLNWDEGGRFLTTLRQSQPDAALVIFTRVDDAAVTAEAMRAGAADYLIKSSEGYLRLAAAVQGAWERARSTPGDARRLTERISELEQANRDLSEFPYLAAHELHAPLRTLERHLDRLGRTKDQLDADGQQALQLAATGAGWMQALIDNLLTHARIGTEAPSFSTCDCSVIVDRAIREVSAEAGADAAIRRGELPTVVGNPDQLLLLFRNLLANAVKFKAEKTPRIDVSAGADGEWWVFSVRDNGIGLDAQFAEAIFGMFKRLHPERSGTGLGLAICRRIVERHGGRIWAESEPGVGSTFFFTLPRTAGGARVHSHMRPAGHSERT